MRHIIQIAMLCLAVVSIAGLMACDDSTTPEGGGNGNGGGEVEEDFEMPPFWVVRFSTDFRGTNGAYTVGRDGIVLFNAVIGHAVLPTGTRTSLNDAWSVWSDSVFVVGDDDGKGGLILRFLGDKRTRMNHPIEGDVTAVHGTAWNNVYATGTDGRVIRFDGNSWSTFLYQNGVEFQDVWASEYGQLWVVGLDDAIYFHNGVYWENFSSQTGRDCRDVWGILPDSVMIAAGNQIWGFSELGGQQLFETSMGQLILDIDSYSDHWIVAAGNRGTVVRYDGSAWSEDVFGGIFPIADLRAVWAVFDLAYVYGEDGSLVLFDDTWKILNISEESGWADVHGVSADDTYGIMGGDLMKRDPPTGNWTLQTAGPADSLYAFFCTGPDEVWAIGAPDMIDRFAYHYNRPSWDSYWLSSMSDGRDIWCEDNQRVCIVGDHASVWYYNGSNFTPTQALSPPQHLHGVWGHDWNHIYAVGDNGTIVFSDDGCEHWSSMTSPTSAHLRDVWGWGADRVVAVGDGGVVAGFDGTDWTAESTGITEDLHHVWGDADDNIWVASNTTIVYHYDGTSFKRYDTSIPDANIRGVWGSANSNLWFVCDKDYVLKYADF